MKLSEWVGGLLFGGGIGLAAFWEWKQETEKPKTMIPATSGTKKDFVDTMRAAINGLSTSVFSEPGKALLIAWAAFETNWGRTSGWIRGNNAFNITAGSVWKGQTVPGPDTEYDGAGNVKNITQAWRKYPSAMESIKDMVDFIGQARFGAARVKLVSGDITFVRDLYAGKYYTLPPEKYQAGVAATLVAVKPLIPIVPPVS